MQDLILNSPMTVPHSKLQFCDIEPRLDHLMEGYDELYKEKIQWDMILSNKDAHKKRKLVRQKAPLSYTKHWMEDESVICTRDDKSKKIALICRDQYFDLLTEFITQ